MKFDPSEAPLHNQTENELLLKNHCLEQNKLWSLLFSVLSELLDMDGEKGFIEKVSNNGIINK